MIYVTDSISLDEREIQEDFVRASGPGGQNVNKVSTAVQLRFDVMRSPSLPDFVRERLVVLAGRRLSNDGVLVISAERFSSQRRNRDDALARLIAL
ncbi:MAG: alternative ribosome rescue aminoacyl-tRNA hydrolase ArfB, partial [Pseudomonadota bacterium]